MTASPPADVGALRASRRRGLSAVALAYALALGAALAAGAALRGRHALLVAAAADLCATLAVFAASVRHDNSSLYDPYWSVAPVPVAAYWAWAGEGAPAWRQALVLLLVSAWGVRLTANWAARWRGLADEDFRYAEIRRRTGRLYWPASLVSIHLLPTAWVFLGMLPVHAALSGPGRPLGLLDLAGAALAGGAIAVEALADRQLRAFLRSRPDPAAVLDTGLWALCRHPNYLGEVLFWWGLLLLGIAADPGSWWRGVGALSITLLFLLVSVPWMDRRMAERHPAWAARMASAPALLPWPRRRR
jgi:steroid 5-alpha reductase family enzyme